MSGDAVTGLTDGSFTKRISKNGAAYGAMTVTISEMENGWYSIPLSTGHSDTLGLLTIVFTNGGAKQVNLQFRVTAKLIDDLNDVAATDIVSAGAITTSSGAVVSVTTSVNLTNLPSIPSNWITAGGINANALDGKGDWNIGKTGYTLTQAFPTNFADLSIVVTSGLVDITQAAADKVWGTAARVLTAGTNIVLAKGVGVTGFNDIAATAVVSAGAITTLSGAVVNVDLVDTLTTYTGNTLQTADVATLITTVGTDGDGLTSINLPNQTMDIIGDITGNLSGSVGSVTGHTNQTGDTFALANGTEGFVAIDTVVDAVKVVTDALTSAAAAKLALSAAGIEGGAAVTGTLSTTVMTSDLTGFLDDELIGRTVIWTGGQAKGQASDITDYASASGTVTYTAITTPPLNNDTFVIV